MKLGIKLSKGTIKCNECYEAESIEEKLRRVTITQEPIEAVAPMIYTEAQDGVRPEYDIRTDRWDIAQDAMTKVEASNAAKRQEIAERKAKGEEVDATELEF